jgi:hypothetical protein
MRSGPLLREPWRTAMGPALLPGVPLFSDWLP